MARRSDCELMGSFTDRYQAWAFADKLGMERVAT